MVGTLFCNLPAVCPATFDFVPLVGTAPASVSGLVTVVAASPGSFFQALEL